MSKLPAIIAALTSDLGVADFHRRFRIRDGVTILHDLHKDEPADRRRKLNTYTMSIFTRLVHQRHRLEVPVRAYVLTMREYALDLIDLDEFGVPHPKVVGDGKDVEAETMAIIAKNFEADFQDVPFED